MTQKIKESDKQLWLHFAVPLFNPGDHFYENVKSWLANESKPLGWQRIIIDTTTNNCDECLHDFYKKYPLARLIGYNDNNKILDFVL